MNPTVSALTKTYISVPAIGDTSEFGCGFGRRALPAPSVPIAETFLLRRPGQRTC